MASHEIKSITKLLIDNHIGYGTYHALTDNNFRDEKERFYNRKAYRSINLLIRSNFPVLTVGPLFFLHGGTYAK